MIRQFSHWLEFNGLDWERRRIIYELLRNTCNYIFKEKKKLNSLFHAQCLVVRISLLVALQVPVQEKWPTPSLRLDYGCNTRFGGTVIHLSHVKMSSFSAKAGDQNQTFQSWLLLLNVAAWMCSMTKMDNRKGHSGMTIGGDLLVLTSRVSTLNSSRTFQGWSVISYRNHCISWLSWLLTEFLTASLLWVTWLNHCWHPVMFRVSHYSIKENREIKRWMAVSH